MMFGKDLTGQHIGRLVVIGPYRKSSGKSGLREWQCQCECGEKVWRLAWSLLHAQKRNPERVSQCDKCISESIKNRRTKHGFSKHRLFGIWQCMVRRCYDTTDIGYKNYGGRGISVCDRWRFGENGLSGYECFAEDMGDRPSLDLSIDRIDNDLNYAPGNCKWSTRVEQNRNKRKTTKSAA